MKKYLAILLSLCMILVLVSCSSNPASSSTSSPSSSSQESSAPASSGDIAWPTTKNLTWLIGASAGGATDLNTKALTCTSKDYFDANIVLEYINGGGGTVMQTQLMDEPNDGSVLATLAVGSALIKPWTTDLPYSPEDFTYIAGYTITESVLVVNSDFPADTFEEFVEEVKAHPGEYTFSQGSVGGIGHLQTAIMLYDSGILDDVVMISFDSGGEAVVSLVGNHVDFTVASIPEISQYVEDGSMKVLAVSGDSRSETYPDVPCCGELGLTVLNSRGVICGPGGMDPALVEVISDYIRQWLEDPQVVETFETMGQAIQYVDSATITQECYDLYDTAGEILPKLGFEVIR